MPTAAKVAYVEALVAAGLRRIEAVSFVHPERVPQMADAEEVMARRAPRRPGSATPGWCSTSAAWTGRWRPGWTR